MCVVMGCLVHFVFFAIFFSLISLVFSFSLALFSFFSLSVSHSYFAVRSLALHHLPHVCLNHTPICNERSAKSRAASFNVDEAWKHAFQLISPRYILISTILNVNGSEEIDTLKHTFCVIFLFVLCAMISVSLRICCCCCSCCCYKCAIDTNRAFLMNLCGNLIFPLVICSLASFNANALFVVHILCCYCVKGNRSEITIKQI